MKTKIEKFLERFPKNATSWADATDEIRDLSRSSREFLSEIDRVAVEPVDFKAITSPAEWNTKGRESILANFDRMSDGAKKRFYDIYKHWFGTLEFENPWAIKMMDDKIYYFATNEDMIAFSVRPRVAYKKMGRAEYIVTE